MRPRGAAGDGTGVCTNVGVGATAFDGRARASSKASKVISAAAPPV